MNLTKLLKKLKTNGTRIRFFTFLLLAIVLILLAFIGRFIAPLDPIETNYAATLQAPNQVYIFGTDKLGRDIWSRILYGAGTSLSMTFLMVVFVSALGTIIGMLSGYLGGVIDTAIMRFVDILLAFPGQVFAIAVAGLLGVGLLNTVLALSFIWWTKYARMARSLTSSIKEKEYVTQARFGGAGNYYIIKKYILPNILSQVVIMATLDIGSMMMALAGLSFLGLASQPPNPEWGHMLYESRQYMQTAPWMMIYPGIAIFITVVIFNLLGDSLRDLLDPKYTK